MITSNQVGYGLNERQKSASLDPTTVIKTNNGRKNKSDNFKLNKNKHETCCFDCAINYLVKIGSEAKLFKTESLKC